MRGDLDEDEDQDFEPGGDGYCLDCGGEGWIVTCVDDLCRGAGYCIHGDGMMLCHCNDLTGDKIAPSNAPLEWRAPRKLRQMGKPKRSGGHETQEA
jgi:hypothetical protein